MESLPTHPELTRELLEAVDRGDRIAAERLAPLVYDELKRIARARMRRLPPGQTLQTTALVHEAWMKLSAGGPRGWSSRVHFFGAAARAMRDVLVDQARRKYSLKRGGGRERVDLDHADAVGPDGAPLDLLDVDAALERFEAECPEEARVVSLKFFVGLTMEEISDLLDVPLRTVERQWRFARAWLQSELRKDHGGRSD